MNWKYKALTHWLLSYSPGGSRAHYWIQKRVTGRIPRSEARLRKALEHANRHADSFERLAGRPLNKSVLFEFGAGWDLPVQLLFFARGAQHQVIVDQTRLIKKELINHSIKRFREMKLEPFQRVPVKMIEGDVEQDLRQKYGIDYRAPWDARETGLPSGSIDLVTSTETLQHVPVFDLFEILTECHRILKPRGLISAAITYDDHYAFSDKRISVFNFLKYSEDTWRLYNPPNHYQNRLRHVEYIALFQQAGFVLLEEDERCGSDAELELLAHLPIDTRFRSLSTEELAVHESHIVFRKDTKHRDACRLRPPDSICSLTESFPKSDISVINATRDYL